VHESLRVVREIEPRAAPEEVAEGNQGRHFHGDD
jgi:hypothetical protein